MRSENEFEESEKFNKINPKSSELIMNKLKHIDEIRGRLNSHLLQKMEMICD